MFTEWTLDNGMVARGFVVGTMARLDRRRSRNVPGDFYVDSSCIDCDTCRWMVPTVFRREDGQSVVFQQPMTGPERRAALQALLACPTASIGTIAPPPDIREVQDDFPLPVTEGVFHCGYHSRDSFGAASYVIVRSQGNVLVDSPRYSAPLAKRLEELGGVRYLVLTHRDDVADHRRWRDRFGCERVLHVADRTEATPEIERWLVGTEVVELAPDLTIIPVPGHSPGHIVLLYGGRVLFSGDHLAYSPHLGHLHGFRRYCWFSWEHQIQSMERLRAYEFEWVLPGHGHRYHAPDAAAMAIALETCITWMKEQI